MGVRIIYFFCEFEPTFFLKQISVKKNGNLYISSVNLNLVSF